MEEGDGRGALMMTGAEPGDCQTGPGVGIERLATEAGTVLGFSGRGADGGGGLRAVIKTLADPGFEGVGFAIMKIVNGDKMGKKHAAFLLPVRAELAATPLLPVVTLLWPRSLPALALEGAKPASKRYFKSDNIRRGRRSVNLPLNRLNQDYGRLPAAEVPQAHHV
ncbi:hypothetical protein SKAU_G00075000 [Synaphobranchus kaupii]|uniref:Uncharacterized protein n=1 Tax=Synaphobranchus kaupii TaxID=118154 RepID=A0A9Q1JC30_SYNKA|nr:hypothetical protein SKAU_G00075000 [Synaphobranchus kaupii]